MCDAQPVYVLDSPGVLPPPSLRDERAALNMALVGAIGQQDKTVRDTSCVERLCGEAVCRGCNKLVRRFSGDCKDIVKKLYRGCVEGCGKTVWKFVATVASTHNKIISDVKCHALAVEALHRR